LVERNRRIRLGIGIGIVLNCGKGLKLTLERVRVGEGWMGDCVFWVGGCYLYMKRRKEEVIDRFAEFFAGFSCWLALLSFVALR